MRWLIGVRFVLAHVLLAVVLPATAGAPSMSEVRVGKHLKETIGRVTSLVSGDVACYVGFTSDAGVEHLEMADFDVCGEKIVGLRVRFRYQSVRVLAPVCMGDPACRHTVLEPLIVAATVIDPKAAPGHPKPAAAPSVSPEKAAPPRTGKPAVDRSRSSA